MAHSRSRRRECLSVIGTERNPRTDHASSSYQICHDVACIPLVWRISPVMCELLGGFSAGKSEPIMISHSQRSAVSRRSSVFKRTLSSLIKLSSRREHMSPASAKRMRARKSVGCRTPLSVFLFFAGTRTDEVSLDEAARPETSLLHFALGRLIARQYSRMSLCLLSPARCESPLVLFGNLRGMCPDT